MIALERASNRDLVVAARDGSQRAWDMLVTRCAQDIWDVIRSHGLDPRAAAEVHQLTWIDLADHLEDLDDREDIGRWLRRTAAAKSLHALTRHAVERRACVRVQANLPLTLSPADDDRLFSGRCLDLSVGGMHARTRAPLEAIKQPLLLAIAAPERAIVSRAAIIDASLRRRGDVDLRLGFCGLSGPRRDALSQLLERLSA